MPKITAGTSVKAALLAAFPFLVGINGTEESLHEYLAIFVLLIAVQHLLKQKWWFRMMRFGLRNQPLKLKIDRRFVGELLLYGYLGNLGLALRTSGSKN